MFSASTKKLRHLPFFSASWRIRPSADFFFFLFSYFLITCEKQTTPVEDKRPVLNVTLQDVAVTEAWLQIETGKTTPEDSLILLRNDSAVFRMFPVKSDTLVYDEGLLPAHEYNYQTVISRRGHIMVIEELTATTMDTTSHDFQWEIIEFPSPFGSGALYDIAIVSKFEAWAVGEIYADSAKPWLPYNAVHITLETGGGVELESLRIPYIYNGSPIVSPLSWVYAQNENDIWFSNSVHWNGKYFENADIAVSIFSGIGINKIWGTPDGELYVVGNKGNIAYSPDHGSNWQKLESGTDLPIQDIWGMTDPQTGKQIILAPASTKYTWNVPLLLNISPAGVSREFLSVYNLIHSVWFKSLRKVYLCGSGVYCRTNGTWNRLPDLPTIFTNRIRGNDDNDIWVVGDFGIALHFNGVSWREYPQLWLQNGKWEGLAVTNDLVAIVGRKGADAVMVVTRLN
ncbi:MAG: hypothetical protein JXL67_13625 [Calditrichaeota bacterium]|nr:hypothetical protein [Calditrichota bacterium]